MEKKNCSATTLRLTSEMQRVVFSVGESHVILDWKMEGKQEILCSRGERLGPEVSHNPNELQLGFFACCVYDTVCQTAAC